MATFLVVSFSERVMSSSLISCGFFISSLFFSSRARFPILRFFCSMDSGPSLSNGAKRYHSRRATACAI